ncbi:hypothetical protein BSKO_00056 [Bryopsis sp. KO-2023]|nr:hypothetical protein BSKO_00056 [Bryopsis sp. KO-2023]
MTGYAFLVLIIITVYTANMTANLTVSKITATVNSLHDLPEARVGVVPVYKHRLEEHGITKFYTIESNDTTMDVALNALATGEADALAMASEWIAKVLLDRGCRDSVYMFNLEMESFDYALPFPARVPSRVMDRVNNAIINLSEDSQLQRIADDFGSNHDCLRSPIDDPLTVLGIWQVYGVWVLMSACIFLASMISVARCIMRRYKVYTVRMPAFVQFEGEERDIEMMAAPVAGTSNGQGSGEKVENTQAVNEIQRELREMRVELLQQIKQANRRRPKPRFQRGWKLPIGKESKK